jgi:hypothetical protein
MVSAIALEKTEGVVDSLLDLAYRRSFSIPMRWLGRKIETCRNRVQLHRLLRFFVRLLPQSRETEIEDALSFLHRLVAKALSDEETDGETDLSKALIQVVSSDEWDTQWRLSEPSLKLARATLARFAEKPGKVSEGNVLLAASIAGHCRDAAARDDLRTALDVILSLAERPGGQQSERLASAIAQALLEIAPVELLNYPANCEPVRAALRSRALQRGWVVFQNRIVDAEGNEICQLGRSSPTESDAPKPAEISEILAVLSKRQRDVLLSYWLMTRDGGACQPSDSLKSIYERLQAQFNEQGETLMDEQGRIRRDSTTTEFDNLFQNEAFPTFETWRKTLNRIEDRFERQPDILLMLHHIGLCRRS